MKKLKSNDQHSPLQFVSPYTALQCQYHLYKQFHNEDGRVSFTYIDETLTKFRINYRYGSNWIIAQGSLKAWVGGQQTRVFCRVVSVRKKDNTFQPAFIAAVAYIFLLLLFAYLLLIFDFDTTGFLFAIGLCIGPIGIPVLGVIIFGRSNLILSPFAVESSPASPENLSAKAESQFYDRLIALLSEPEPLDGQTVESIRYIV